MEPARKRLSGCKLQREMLFQQEKIIKFNTYIGVGTRIHESQRPHMQGGSEAERERRYASHPELGVRKGGLGASVGHCRVIRAPA